MPLFKGGIFQLILDELTSAHPYAVFNYSKPTSSTSKIKLEKAGISSEAC